MILTDAETATVLAALRHWQNMIRTSDPSAFPHFEDVEPLNPAEIDQLCEKINFDGEVRREISAAGGRATAQKGKKHFAKIGAAGAKARKTKAGWPKGKSRNCWICNGTGNKLCGIHEEMATNRAATFNISRDEAISQLRSIQQDQ